MSKKDNKENEVKDTKDMTTEELSNYVTKEAKKDLLMDIGPYLIIIFFVVIIRMFFASPVRVNGTSMYPTLQEGDNMILYKLSKRTRGIKRFDIVVVKTEKDEIIKRVIGLPGETVKYEVTEDEESGKNVAPGYIDGKIIEGRTDIDIKALTGESLPKEVTENENILSGCINLTSVIKIKVTKRILCYGR